MFKLILYYFSFRNDAFDFDFPYKFAPVLLERRTGPFHASISLNLGRPLRNPASELKKLVKIGLSAPAFEGDS
jgi:hypothetical protein